MASWKKGRYKGIVLKSKLLENYREVSKVPMLRNTYFDIIYHIPKNFRNRLVLVEVFSSLVFNFSPIGACQNFDIFDMTYVDMGHKHLRHAQIALPKVHIDFGVDTTN